MPASKLSLPASVSELQDVAETHQNIFLGRVWSVADSTVCCTLVVPDSELAVRLLRQVAAAFIPAPRIVSVATQVLERFYTRAHEEAATPVAIHWRGQSDMAGKYADGTSAVGAGSFTFQWNKDNADEPNNNGGNENCVEVLEKNGKRNDKDCNTESKDVFL